jgi:hypothetical protein
MSEFKQRADIKFRRKEGCLTENIHDRPQAFYGYAAYAVTSTYFWIKEFKCARADIVDQSRSGRDPIDNLDADISCVMRQSPFRIFRSIAEEVGISPETVHRRLTEPLELRSRLMK